MTEATQARLLAARWMVDAGAGASACRLLADARGRDANDLREASLSARLRPAIYALVVHGGDGLVFPLQARVGMPASASADLRASCMDALTAVRGALGVPSLPALRLELEELLAVSGTSLGLPAALAFVMHLAPASVPKRAVLATGRLDADGRVLPVTHLAAKLAAAEEEQGERVVIVPRGQAVRPEHVEVDSLAQAIEVTCGTTRPAVSALIAVDTMIERARAEVDPLRMIALLEAIDVDVLEKADRARVHLELGTALRHAGRSEAAAEHHGRARELFATERLVIGAETAERFELEAWLTAVDAFRLDEARAAIEVRLSEPFMSVRNELRCRGMLAQILAMQGAYAEAVRVREKNLPLHALSDDLARVLPGTLCYLALDSARSGDAERFEHHARELVRATRLGDANQWRYTAYALVRSWVALGRHREAVAWASGESELERVRAPAATIALVTASGAPTIATHPETSLARALVRAYRQLGRPADAIALGARVAAAPSEGADLVAWLARLVDLEVALAEGDLGRNPSARLASARAALARLHEAASTHHALLLTAPPAALAPHLDRVFY